MTNNSKEKNFDLKNSNFQENYENNLLMINQKIAEQENKKNEISCFLETVSEMNTVSCSPETCTKEITEITENISDNIQKLILLKNELIKINELYLSPDNSNSENNETDIQNMINSCQESFNSVSEIIASTDKKIDIFIKKINQSDTSENINIEDSVPDSNNKVIKDNNTLIISEKENKIFLPYSESDLQAYLREYPKVYTSLENVINREFILPLDYFTKHPSLSRFREAYSLIRDREAKSVFEALNFGFNLMFNYDLNPAIISACKTEESLNFYIDCLENNKLSEFDLFKIEFRLNPLKTSK